MQEETALKNIGAVRHRLSEPAPAPSSEVLCNPYKWWSGPSRIGRHRFDLEKLAGALSDAGIERVEFVELWQREHKNFHDPEISLDGELVIGAMKT